MPKRKLLLTLISIFLLASVIAVMGWSKLTGPQYRYAYVNPQQLAEAFQQSAEFQSLRQATEEEYNRVFKALQAETGEKVETLKREKAEQQKGKSNSEQKRIEDEFGTKLQKLYATNQAELKAKENELYVRLEQAIEERLMGVTAQVAQAEGIPCVLNGQVIYSGGRDLTEQVLAILKNSGEQEHE